MAALARIPLENKELFVAICRVYEARLEAILQAATERHAHRNGDGDRDRDGRAYLPGPR